MPGQQSAIVTGPQGEEIYCDEYGRVKVQFYWDRQGRGDENTSTWLRVSQGWAGNGYGQFMLPRVGMEVLVSFIDGDPDRPIITGCLYNGANRVPYALPEHKTRSTFKTASSPRSSGESSANANELRFEDKAGQEQIYLHAAKDYDQLIDHNKKTEVLNDRHTDTHGTHYGRTRGDHHHTVNGTHYSRTDGDRHEQVGGSRHTELGSQELLKAGREIHLSSGHKVVLDAGAELTLKAGGSMIKLDPAGITLLGPNIKMNSGGSPGKGAGAAAAIAALPDEVEEIIAAKKMLKAKPNGPSHPPKVSTGPEELIVDVWGDPGMGAQVTIEKPESSQ
ncbi:type VI secretion system Vgr family protein [Oceanimonas baumannii]|uniref:Type VI secretion system secreted protein VgrG n=1 Tax=Oceanimonas baumannii TaxID=129578 RepID=A0A235C8X6_9GAMM|nr:type VI secretion system tip protein TssI/VgrG [Oceanimonas baumannii]OYD21078.1 hypothetical protein B6S09_17600 [Oceanimonas baumannii]TDW53985.1 type VI secretion system secreted protein VgrG [Oceanimonas baumannii]